MTVLAGTFRCTESTVATLPTKDGSTIGAVAYGQGGADAFVVTVADGATDLDGPTVADQLEAKEYVPYVKHLEYRERYDYQGVPNA